MQRLAGRREPSNLWISGTFAKTNDADWYRFTMSKAGKIRLVLGDLTTGGRMDLYSGCSTLLQSSDRAGNGAEEIIRSLAAGTYAVKLSGSGSGATPPYVVRMRVLPATVHILSTKTRIEGGTLRLIGELYNNTTKTVGFDQGHRQAVQRLERAPGDADRVCGPVVHGRRARRHRSGSSARCRPGITTPSTRSARRRPRA